MPKKRKSLVSLGQIILVLVSLYLFFMYFVFQIVYPTWANAYLIIGFVFVALTILLETAAYEEIPMNQRDFSYEQPESATITHQAVELSEALRERGINNEREHGDGHKHVDIYIPEAKLYLEVDGEYHLLKPEHLYRDLQRDACSHKDGIDTIRIPNFYVENYLDELAISIAEVARKRQVTGIYAQSRRRY